MKVKAHWLANSAEFGKIKEELMPIYYVVVKLPLILFTIVFGFLLEFLVELPLIALVLLDYRSNIKKSHR